MRPDSKLKPRHILARLQTFSLSVTLPSGVEDCILMRRDSHCMGLTDWRRTGMMLTVSDAGNAVVCRKAVGLWCGGLLVSK